MTLARTRRRTEDCEPVGGSGDADERETDPASSLQAELESEFSAITLSRKKALLRPLATQSLPKALVAWRSPSELA